MVRQRGPDLDGRNKNGRPIDIEELAISSPSGASRTPPQVVPIVVGSGRFYKLVPGIWYRHGSQCQHQRRNNPRRRPRASEGSPQDHR